MKKATRPSSNALLYAHVTRVGFDLSLGRTHVAALVYAHLSMEHHRDTPAPTHPLSGAFRNWIGGSTGLIARGLLVYHFDPKAQYSNKSGLKHHFTITPAGLMVIGLLQESGLYDEYAAAIPVRKGKAA